MIGIRHTHGPQCCEVHAAGVSAMCCVAGMPSCTGAEQESWSSFGAGVGPAGGAAGRAPGAANCGHHTR